MKGYFGIFKKYVEEIVDYNGFCYLLIFEWE